MILCDRADIEKFTESGAWGDATLDGLLRETARQHPQRVALCALSNGSWTSLTFAELDAQVDRLAQLLMASGLRQDDAVAYQLPNCVEAYVTLLGVMRAQGIACPLPMTWRESEISMALAQVNARIVITCDEYGGHGFADMMRFVAAENFSVRRLLAHGDDLPDGVEAIAQLLSGAPEMDLPSPRRDAANHVASFCFGETEGTLRPVARSHAEWIAASRMPLAAMRLSSSSRLLSGQYPTRLASVASAVGPWLLSGCTLAIFDALDFPLSDEVLAESKADTLLMPYSAVEALAENGRIFSIPCSLGVIWNASVLAEAKTPLQSYSVNVTDIVCFDEAALIARRRKQGDMANEWRVGEQRPAEAGLDSAPLLELRLSDTSKGEIELTGAMMPSAILGASEDSKIHRMTGNGRDFISCGLRGELCGANADRIRITGNTASTLHIANHPIAANELDQLIRQHSGIIDAASFCAPHKVLGKSLQAAIRIDGDRRVTLEDLQTFLGMKRLGVHKQPEAVWQVDAIPRDDNQNVLRDKLRRAG